MFVCVVSVGGGGVERKAQARAVCVCALFVCVEDGRVSLGIDCGGGRLPWRPAVSGCVDCTGRGARRRERAARPAAAPHAASPPAPSLLLGPGPETPAPTTDARPALGRGWWMQLPAACRDAERGGRPPGRVACFLDGPLCPLRRVRARSPSSLSPLSFFLTAASPPQRCVRAPGRTGHPPLPRVRLSAPPGVGRAGRPGGAWQGGGGCMRGFSGNESSTRSMTSSPDRGCPRARPATPRPPPPPPALRPHQTRGEDLGHRPVPLRALPPRRRARHGGRRG